MENVNLKVPYYGQLWIFEDEGLPFYKVSSSDSKNLKYDIHACCIAINVMPNKKQEPRTLILEFKSDQETINYTFNQEYKIYKLEPTYPDDPKEETDTTITSIVIKSVSVNDIPASGGSISNVSSCVYEIIKSDGSKVSSGGSIKVTGSVNGDNLHKIETNRTKKGSLSVVVSANGINSLPFVVDVYLQANTKTLVSAQSIKITGLILNSTQSLIQDEGSVSFTAKKTITTTSAKYSYTSGDTDGGTSTSEEQNITSEFTLEMKSPENSTFQTIGSNLLSKNFIKSDIEGSYKFRINSTNTVYSNEVTINKINTKVTTNDVTIYVGQWQGLKSVFNATPIDELIANATPHTFSDTLALDFTATKNTFYFIYPTDKVECTKFQYMAGVLDNLLDGNTYNISRTDGNYTTLGNRSTTVTEDNPLTYNIAFKTK